MLLVPVVVLHPGLNEMTSLSNIHLATLTENVVHTKHFQSVILNRMEGAGGIPAWQANTSEVVFGQQYASITVCHPDIWQKGN